VIALAKWAITVKTRDGYVCTNCGTDKNIDAHHIVPEDKGGTRTIENGISLCRKCHRVAHGHGAGEARLTFRISSRDKRLLKEYCAENNTDISVIVREQIHKWFRHEISIDRRLVTEKDLR
jgi:hypothetical protein